MAKLLNMETLPIVGGSYNFSAIRPEELGSTEYTLVTIVVDITGSVMDFADELLNAVKTAVKSCQKSPRAENLLVRLVTFNTGIYEVHGFVPLNTLNPDDYKQLQCGGLTALYDAAYESVGATLGYSKKLISQDFDVNGIVFVITDGLDNQSSMTPAMISSLVETALTGEEIESLITVLVGINASAFKRELEDFKDLANMTQYIDVGEATDQKLAKLAAFVSRSISSQSQSLGTGGASQPISF